MKNYIQIVIILIFFIACKSTKEVKKYKKVELIIDGLDWLN